MSDRKYRQRGYQDDDRPATAARTPARPGGDGDAPPKPRGRGLGMPTATVFRCASCGRPTSAPAGHDAPCPACGAALHSCTNCVSFDSGAPRECRQPVAERIPRKAEANRCELFAPRLAQEFEREERRAPDDPRAAFDALFKI
ncbi:MAG: hypothetical protein M5U13_06020 [Thermoanaerobaculia bacterium]|nr:hypothetical protein [Thermoanaerobaculia bacterium]